MAESENVQVIQDLYAAFGRGDLAGVLNLLDENVDWHFNGRPQDIPFAGRWQGHAKMVDFFSTLAHTCEVIEFGPHEIFPIGQHVLALGHERVRAKATNRIFESDWIHLFTVSDKKVVRTREFYDTAAVAEAFLESA